MTSIAFIGSSKIFHVAPYNAIKSQNERQPVLICVVIVASIFHARFVT